MLRPSDAIQIAVKDARVASVGLKQNEGICEWDEPWLNGRLK